MPGAFYIELPDEIGAVAAVSAEWDDFFGPEVRTEKVDLATSKQIAWPGRTTLCLGIPPAVAPGGTVTLKGNAADTGQTIANNLPFVITSPTGSNLLVFVVSADAGIWTLYFV